VFLDFFFNSVDANGILMDFMKPRLGEEITDANLAKFLPALANSKASLVVPSGTPYTSLMDIVAALVEPSVLPQDDDDIHEFRTDVARFVANRLEDSAERAGIAHDGTVTALGHEGTWQKYLDAVADSTYYDSRIFADDVVLASSQILHDVAFLVLEASDSKVEPRCDWNTVGPHIKHVALLLREKFVADGDDEEFMYGYKLVKLGDNYVHKVDTLPDALLKQIHEHCTKGFPAPRLRNGALEV
jgi:hypothetical protein